MKPTSCTLGPLKFVIEAKLTLCSKFFGKTNGTRPEPQQSKLSFSTRSSINRTKQSDEADEASTTSPSSRPPSPTKEVSKEGNKEEREGGDMATVKTQSSDSDSDIPAAPRQGVKRKLKEEVANDEETKKQRVGSSLESTNGKTKHKAQDPRRPRTKARSRSPLVKERISEDLTSASGAATGPEPSPEDLEGDAQSAPAESTSEQDDEGGILSDEEEEKSGAARKAREKVQSTLKAAGKDPYPDWNSGEPVPYAALCTTFSKIEMTTKRLEILAHCSLFLRQVLRLTPDDLLPTILLMTNKLAADYVGIELGIGESLIMKAIGESTGRNLKDVKADQNEIGDLGLVAAKSKSKQQRLSFGMSAKPLTVRGVHSAFKDIAVVEGQGAQGRKVGAINKLLSAADSKIAGKDSKTVDITKDKGGPSEAKFLVRTLEGKLRLGLAERTILVALAQAMVFHEVEQKGSKVPSTQQLEDGEKMLKRIYR